MPPPVAETFADMDYPVNGVDLSAGYYAQRPGTTRVGVNVRTCEPLTQRMRGGQRPGLSAYLPQLPSGSHMIQHLGVVVDPSGDALPWNFTYPNLDLFDPSSPGLPGDWGPGYTSRVPKLGGNPSAIPTGGWLYQPNKNTPAPKSGKKSIKLVQSVLTSNGVLGGVSASYTSPVTTGNLLLVAVQQLYFTSSSVSITDTQGNLYSQAGSFSPVPGHTHAVVSLWYAVANGSGANTATATCASDAIAIPVYLTEWSGVSQTSPLDGTATGGADQSGVSGNATLSTGAVTLGGSGDLLFGYFAIPDNPGDGGSFTAGTGFTNLATALGKCGTYQIAPPAGSLAASVTCFLNSNSRWTGVAASFKAA